MESYLIPMCCKNMVSQLNISGILAKQTKNSWFQTFNLYWSMVSRGNIESESTVTEIAYFVKIRLKRQRRIQFVMGIIILYLVIVALRVRLICATVKFLLF